MAQPALLISSDLSAACIYERDAPPDHASLTPPPNEDAPVSETARRRVDEVARWVAAHPQVRRRLAALVIDTDETECHWVQAPSASPAVVANALRSQNEDWASLFPVGGVHPLKPAPEAKKKRRSKDEDDDAAIAPGPKALAVLTVPDALVRLLLDELDRLSVRPARVLSLFHAMAAAQQQTRGLAATILHQPGRRTVWAWSQDGDLVAAGRAGLPRSRPPATDATEPTPDNESTVASRIALDWAAWSASLATTPESVRIIAAKGDEANAERLAAALRARLGTGGISVSCHCEDNPEAAIAEAAASSDSASPRRELSRLTARPSRATRRRYVLIALTLLIAAAAIGGLGFRLEGAAAARLAAAEEERDERQAWLAENAPDLPVGPGGSSVAALRAELNQVRAAPPFPEPPSPRPIITAFEATFDVLDQPRYDGIQLTLITVGSAIGESRLELDSIPIDVQTPLIADITAAPGPLRWERAASGRASERSAFTGEWRE